MAEFDLDKKGASPTGTKIWVSLWKSGRSIESHALASIASLGMSLTDFAVLEVLLHKGPLPVNTIGKKVLLTSGSITTAVDRLEEKGLVERLDSPSDRRVRIVSLTKEGTRQIKVAFAEHQKQSKCSSVRYSCLRFAASASARLRVSCNSLEIICYYSSSVVQRSGNSFSWASSETLLHFASAISYG